MYVAKDIFMMYLCMRCHKFSKFENYNSNVLNFDFCRFSINAVAISRKHNYNITNLLIKVIKCEGITS